MAVAVEGFPPPSMPSRVMVRSYRAYPDAEQAVDRLAGEEIPAERVTIVARGLARVEGHTAARDGAVAGAALGALIGAVLWAVGWAAADVGAFPMIVTGAILGVIAGTAAGIGAHVFNDSNSRVDVAHYDVLVDEDVAGDARALLSS